FLQCVCTTARGARGRRQPERAGARGGCAEHQCRAVFIRRAGAALDQHADPDPRNRLRWAAVHGDGRADLGLCAPVLSASRAGSPLPFDNPNDYSGYSETGIVAPDGTAVAGLGTYSASVVATQQSMGNVPTSDGLLAVVTATGPDGQPVTLTTFRARYAP